MKNKFLVETMFRFKMRLIISSEYDSLKSLFKMTTLENRLSKKIVFNVTKTYQVCFELKCST